MSMHNRASDHFGFSSCHGFEMVGRTALALASIATLALACFAPSIQLPFDEFPKHDVKQFFESQHSVGVVHASRFDSDLSEFRFGYVEFDWPPGGVPGFEPIPSAKRSLASVPAHR
jgi:hypothetical protein